MRRSFPAVAFFRLLNRRQRVAAMAVFAFLAGLGYFVLAGRVVSVADGDTLSVLQQGSGLTKIRLYGIDSPERDQPGGAESAAFAEGLALLRGVTFTTMDTDRYGRSVAIVTLPDGRILNEEMVRNGHAWVYTAYCETARCRYWKKLEKEARAARKGLWEEKKPISPWLWRQRKKRRR